VSALLRTLIGTADTLSSLRLITWYKAKIVYMSRYCRNDQQD
jgi:predicted membrane-bound mannosyltransferase